MLFLSLVLPHTMNIHHLPEEIMHTVFSYFNQRELLILGEVCTHWKRISRDRTFWKHTNINVSQKVYTPPRYRDILNNTEIQSLHIHWGDNTEIFLVPHIPRLKRLSLSAYDFQESQIEHIRHHCPEIQELVLNVKPLSLSSWKCLLTLPHLKSLEIRNEFNDEWMKCLGQKPLEKLCLKKGKITDASLPGNLSLHLKDLTLPCSDLTNECMLFLNELVELEKLTLLKMTHLTHLDPLAQLTHLTTLILHYPPSGPFSFDLCSVIQRVSTNISPESLRSVIRSLPKLTHLDVGNLVINEEVLRDLSQNCKFLEIFRVKTCKNITEAEVINFVKQCPRLKQLRICYQRIRWNSNTELMMDMGHCKKISSAPFQVLVSKIVPSPYHLKFYLNEQEIFNPDFMRDVFFSKTKKLTVICHTILNEDIFIQLAECFSPIQELVIHYTVWYAEWLQPLITLPQLRSLTFIPERKTRAVHMREVAEKCIYLHEIVFPFEYCIYRINTFCVIRQDTLTSITLNGTIVNNEFFRTLSHCSRLTSLSLHRCRNITWEVIEYFYMPHLTFFYISDQPKLTDRDYVHMFRNIPQLTHIHLNSVNVNDTCLKILSDVCPLLKEVRLHYCSEVSNLGLKNLLENSSQLSNLEIYGFSKDKINARFKEYIPMYRPHLTCIYSIL